MKDWYRDIGIYYTSGLWTQEMVANAVKKGKITQEQYEQIIAPKENKEESDTDSE